MGSSKVGWGTMLLLLGGLAGCAHKPRPVPPSHTPRPQPPPGAAAGLAIPQAGPDGRFTTINSGLGQQEALWHVRAALNVAALGCRDDAIVRAYNQWLTQRKTALASAYASEASRFRAAGGQPLDRHMTQLYNFFAQPPAQAGFCRAANREAARIVSIPAAELPAHAAGAIERLEAPFLAFYRSYASYRRDLAAWKANPHAASAPAAIAMAAPVQKAQGAALSTNWRIQIGAFTGKAAAKAAWTRARATVPGLATYTPHYEKVPGRPELVRVQLGSAAERAGALRLCAAAAAGGFDCIPQPRR